MTPMRIGIDCRTMLDWRKGGEAAGIGHYTYYLVKHLLRQDHENEYVLFVDRHLSGRVKAEFGRRQPNKVAVRHFPFQVVDQAMPFVYGHMAVSVMFERLKLDLLHAPANALPLFYHGRAVVTVHDLAIYDHPDWFPSPYPGTLGFAERVIVPYSVKHARRVIAVSKQTKRDLQRIFRLPGRKIDVVYEGAEEPPAGAFGEAADKTLKDLGLTRGKYFLYLGTVETRKNVPALVRAFVTAAGRSGGRGLDLDLIIAGKRGWNHDAALKAMRAANAQLGPGVGGRERVRYLGYLPAGKKPAVIAGAAAFVFPSLYEGFGLPVIEAMSLGVPVIASDRASLPEICGDAAILVNPEKEAAIANAMLKLSAKPDLAVELGRRGAVRAAGFTWEKAARETLAVYRKALADS